MLKPKLIVAHFSKFITLLLAYSSPYVVLKYGATIWVSL